MQRTFVAIKPIAVKRELIGEIITRFERKGYKTLGLKMLKLDRELATKHYEEHIDKPFFEDLVEFITSGPVVAMVFEGENAIEGVRHLVGATDPLQAAPGTIRADYAQLKNQNVVHASDSKTSAEREIALYFDEKELY